MSISVEDLVTRAGQGDREAECAVCRAFAPAVRAFARRRLRTTDRVEEFTQDVLLVFVEALRNRSIEEPARVGGFVLGICRKLSHDQARARERRAALWDVFGADVAAVDEEPHERAVYELIHLEDCISQLSKRARDVVRLTYLEPVTAAEVATALGTTEGNVRVMRHRVLGSLRDCMSKRISWEAA